MDFDDEDNSRRHSLGAADPLPPDDWDGFGRRMHVEALYVAQRPYLAGFFRRKVHPQEVADLVQECFRRLISSKSLFTGGLDNPRAYLARTAQNLLKNRARTAARRHHMAHHSFEEGEVAGPDPHAALEARDLLHRIEEAVANLNPKTRDIFLMHRFDGLSYEEIARIMGMSSKRVEKHIAKAILVICRVRDTQS